MQQIIKIAPRKPPFEWLGDLFAITLKTEEAFLQFFERLEIVGLCRSGLRGGASRLPTFGYLR